jgi:excinuclease UvrABC ATPase subunit
MPKKIENKEEGGPDEGFYYHFWVEEPTDYDVPVNEKEEEYIPPNTPTARCENCNKIFPVVIPTKEKVVTKQKQYFLSGGVRVMVRTEEDIKNNIVGSKDSKEMILCGNCYKEFLEKGRLDPR